jgi:hypothetical protein
LVNFLRSIVFGDHFTCPMPLSLLRLKIYWMKMLPNDGRLTTSETAQKVFVWLTRYLLSSHWGAVSAYLIDHWLRLDDTYRFLYRRRSGYFRGLLSPAARCTQK